MRNPQSAILNPQSRTIRPPRIDVHAHLAGIGTDGSGCWTSPVFRRRYTFLLLRLWHRITPHQMRTSVDADWAAMLARAVRHSELDHAVALGFDGVYRADGSLDRERTQMLVPPAWVFEVCRRHPELLPGPSVHPLRPDALERLDECIERGAVLIKWLPPAQGIDPAHPATRPFYRRMADAGLPLLVHSGGSERTFAEVAPSLIDLRLLRGPLEAGVPVICAHSGVPVLFSDDLDQQPLLRSMLRRYPNLWVDNSGMANPSRFAHLPRLARDPEITTRTLFGTDFPVPASALLYLRELGAEQAGRIMLAGNPFDRDIRIKRALGYPDETLTRAAEVLAGRMKHYG
jgi:uncharacterized protein